MLQNGHVVSQETFHYLLMGCLKDKQTGFRLALQVDVVYVGNVSNQLTGLDGIMFVTP